jgi:low affinity Fe/Cu permease
VEPGLTGHGSIWPLTIALAVTIVLFGVVTTLVFSAFGLCLLAAGIVGWVRELSRHG